MLVLSRKQGQEVVIGDNIRLTVVSIRGSEVRLGFTAPIDVPIRREELSPKSADCAILAVRPATWEAEP